MRHDPPDLIESILGIAPDDTLGTLRRRRPEALRHAEGAWRELVLPEEPGGFGRTERAAVALRVALIEGEATLAARYRALLARADAWDAIAAAEEIDGPSGRAWPRLTALLRHADLVALHPADVTQAAIDALRALGLSPREVVALTQLVSFVPYQVRLLAGLRAMQAEAAGGGAAPVTPGEAAPRRFTMAEIGWTPRLPPVEEDSATPEQRAALDACPPAQRSSVYFRTLALDPGSLGERGALFTTVMYAPRGLPRAERELATAITSMVNGCVYCTAVHARRFAELTKQPEVMGRLFTEGLAAEADPRRRAIISFAARLTRTPGGITAADLAPLREAGLDGLELLDLVHAVAMFANANRLMQSLGDSGAA